MGRRITLHHCPALEPATDAAQGNREDADRIKGQIADVERQQSNLIAALADGIFAGGKETIARKLAELEAQRNLLLSGIDRLREQAVCDTEGLAKAIRKALVDARQALTSAKTAEQFNRFVEEVFGPLEIQADGSLRQKQLPPVEAEGNRKSNIAGGGFEPPTSGL